jgi:hypothetical protein
LQLYQLETWASKQRRNIQEIEIAHRASIALRDLMTLELSQKNLLKYLHQQMGITPKSERGNNTRAKQPGK